MTTHDDASAFLLTSRDGSTPPALTGVEAHARLDGVLFSATVRQTYRNASARPLEVLYSFPLPHGAVLMSMAAEFDGRRLQGQVLARQQAEATYEQALEDGDAPVLLEAAGDGLHTASLGNLLPGEQVTLELQISQLLGFEQGRVRLALPAAIAPRYGRTSSAGLLPHQVPEASLAVEYPLSVSLTVCGSLARGSIECPTHGHRVQQVWDGIQLTLDQGAVLDRDVVVLVTPPEPVPDLLVVGDDPVDKAAPRIAMAAFLVPPRPARDACRLRLLVDCSGSMAGDAIASARQALWAVTAALRPADEASLTRFGSTWQHAVEPGRCSPAQLQALQAAVQATEASMGGTEMHAALDAVFRNQASEAHPAEVLLITDGEVWGAEELADAARRSGHRVFAIGVGSAPAESLLRQLAETSGGAVEFATPGESMGQAAVRMLDRIRQQPRGPLRVDWGTAPAWELPLPLQAFGGDTVLAMAGFSQRSEPSSPARLLAGTATAGGEALAQTSASVPLAGFALARVAAARRLALLADKEATQLAIDHQLVTRHTHCVLVHERDEASRPTAPSTVQRVPQMLAAGWGGTGRVWASRRSGAAAAVDRLALFECSAESVLPRFCRLQSDDLDDDTLVGSGMEIPPQQSLQDHPEPHLTLREIMHRVGEFLASGGALADLDAHAAPWSLSPVLQQALEDLEVLALTPGVTWWLLALWVAHREGVDGDSAMAMQLQGVVAVVDDVERQSAFRILDTWLGSLSSDGQASARASRLARAVGASS